MDDDEARARIESLEARLLHVQASLMIHSISFATLRPIIDEIGKKIGVNEYWGRAIDDAHQHLRDQALNAVLADLADKNPELATVLREEIRKIGLF